MWPALSHQYPPASVFRHLVLVKPPFASPANSAQSFAGAGSDAAFADTKDPASTAAAVTANPIQVLRMFHSFRSPRRGEFPPRSAEHPATDAVTAIDKKS